MKRIFLASALVIGAVLGIQPLYGGPTNPPPAIHPPATELEKLIKEIKNLPPAEQQTRLKEFNEKHGLKEADIKKQQEAIQTMTPEQRQAKIKARVADFQKKKAAGTLTPAEQGQLKNLENWLQQSQNQVKAKTNAVSGAKSPPVPRK